MSTLRFRNPRWVALLVLSLVLDACGGGGGGSGGSTSSPTYTIGGTVSGLATSESVVLVDNGTDSTTVSSNTTFTFLNAISTGGAYAVSVRTQPAGQTCAVSAGSGVVASSNVSNVSVTCTYNPPQLSSITPSQLPAGGDAFALTANGSNFTAQSVIRWNGSAIPTTFASTSQLAGQVAAAAITTPGSAAVTIYTPLGSGLFSNSLPFTITSSGGGPPVAPQLTSITPSQATAGGPAFALSASGSNFTSRSVIQWNGSSLPTIFISANTLTAQVPAANIAAAGTAAISVYTPAAVGLSSSTMTLTIGSVLDAVAFQVNPAHSGVLNLPAVSFPTAALWHVTLSAAPSYALIADGKVFATVPGSSTSQLYALSQSTGAAAWGPLSVGPNASAAYDAGLIFVASFSAGSSGELQAFDAGTGALKWSVALPSTPGYSGSPTAANGYVYTVYGGEVYAFAESNGAAAWTASAPNDAADNTVAVTGDGVYLSYPCQTIDLNPATGGDLWSNNIVCQGPGGGTAVAANGSIYSPNGFGSLTGNGFGSYGGSVLNAESGALQGLYVSDSLPAVDTRNAYFLQSGTLRAVALGTNKVLWGSAGDGLLTSCPIVVNQYVLVGSSVGNVFAFDSTTGVVAWQTNAGGPIPLGPEEGSTLPPSGLSAGDGLLVVPAGNTLTAYSLSPTGAAPAAPQLASITPSQVLQGGNGFTLTATGASFTQQAELLWNGAPIPTSFVSATVLTAAIPSTSIANPGTAQISVSLGGTASSAATLSIQPVATLSLATATPTTAQVGGAAFVLSLTGGGFTTSDVVQWNGSARATTYVSATELQAEIDATDLTAPGASLVTVYDPSGTGRTSNPVSIVVGSSLDDVSPQITISHAGVIAFPSVSFPPMASWKVTLPGPPSYALIAAGEVFVTIPVSAGSELYAFNQASGAVDWGPIVIGANASLAYDSATLFVMSQTTELGFVQALDPLTGAAQWISPLLGYSFTSGIVASNGLVYASGAASEQLSALSESSGAVSWTATVSGEDSTPAVTQTGVYLAYPAQAYDLAPNTGAKVWSYNSGGTGGGGAMPVVANGLLYWASGLVFNGAGTLTYGGSILNAQTGAVQSTYAADVPPAIGAQSGYFLQSGTLNAVSTSSNTLLWSFTGDGKLATAPIVINQYVAIGSTSGNLYVLDATTGATVWQVNLGQPILAGPVYAQSAPLSGLSAGDGLLVVPAGNTLSAYRIY